MGAMLGFAGYLADLSAPIAPAKSRQCSVGTTTMTDHATPNLPSRDFAVTAAFYARLGFVEGWRDAGWMILTRGDLTLEFFPHPGLDPSTSWFSCCLRLDDLDAFYEAARTAGVPEGCGGQPRLQPATEEASGLRIAYLVDPDGTLVRLIQN